MLRKVIEPNELTEIEQILAEMYGRKVKFLDDKPNTMAQYAIGIRDRFQTHINKLHHTTQLLTVESQSAQEEIQRQKEEIQRLNGEIERLREVPQKAQTRILELISELKNTRTTAQMYAEMQANAIREQEGKIRQLLGRVNHIINPVDQMKAWKYHHPPAKKAGKQSYYECYVRGIGGVSKKDFEDWGIVDGNGDGVDNGIGSNDENAVVGSEGIVYLIQTPDQKEDSVKVGKTESKDPNRLESYGSERHEYITAIVRNPHACEVLIKQRFREEFGNPIKGSETFRAKLVAARSLFLRVLLEYNQ